MPEETVDDLPQAWREVSRRLAAHPTYQSSYLLRVDQVETERGSSVPFNADGRLEVVDGESLRIVASHYAASYSSDSGVKLTCCADGTNLSVASDAAYEVAHRYDSVEFWLHVTAQTFDVLSHITVRLASEATASLAIPAAVSIPVVVRRSVSRAMLRWIVAAAGALMAALPNVTDFGLPWPFKVGAFAAGAGLAAFGAIFLGSRSRTFRPRLGSKLGRRRR
jgi:hypothetical protein